MNSNTCSLYERENAYRDYLDEQSTLADERWKEISELFDDLTKTKEFQRFSERIKWYYERYPHEDEKSDIYELFCIAGAI